VSIIGAARSLKTWGNSHDKNCASICISRGSNALSAKDMLSLQQMLVDPNFRRIAILIHRSR
jgi:hypothetical protein